MTATSLFSEMQREAKALDERIIERERELDDLFAHGMVTRETLAVATAEVAHLQGALREVHLKYHPDTKALLSPDQVAHYNRLRGYRDAGHQR